MRVRAFWLVPPLLSISWALAGCVAVTEFDGYHDRDARVDAAQNDAAMDSGATDSGTTDSGTPVDSGAMDSGTTDSGTTDSGTTDSGTTDSGTPVDSGAMDSGMTCGSGLTLCAASCVNLDEDPSNCGGCGNVCAFSHASAACVTGGCRVDTCHVDFVSCGAPTVDCVTAVTRYDDGDSDRFGDPATGRLRCAASGVADNTDCDDAHSDAYPGAPELCNARDDDCDSLIDEGETLRAQPLKTPVGSSTLSYSIGAAYDSASDRVGLILGAFDSGASTNSTSFQRLNTDGSRDGAPVLVDSTMGSQPALCFDGVGYVSVDVDGGQVWARRLSNTGSPSAAIRVSISGSERDANSPRCATLMVGTTHVIAVVWTSTFLALPTKRVRFALLDWSDLRTSLSVSVVGDLDTDSSISFWQPDVAAVGSAFHVAWSANQCASGACTVAEIRRVDLSAGGVIGSTLAIATGTDATESRPRLAYDSTSGRLAIGYTRFPVGGFDSFARYVIIDLASAAVPVERDLTGHADVSSAFASGDGSFGFVVIDILPVGLAMKLVRVDALGAGAIPTPALISLDSDNFWVGLSTDTPPPGSPGQALLLGPTSMPPSGSGVVAQEIRREPLCP